MADLITICIMVFLRSDFFLLGAGRTVSGICISWRFWETRALIEVCGELN
jgi:hypothetical protein